MKLPLILQLLVQPHILFCSAVFQSVHCLGHQAVLLVQLVETTDVHDERPGEKHLQLIYNVYVDHQALGG